MHITADRIEFAPPAQPGMLRAFTLAVLAHLVLLAALTWGVNWKRQSAPVTAEAELWASVPQQAAPKAVEPPPAPVVATPPPPAPIKETPPPPKEPDIAVQREKPPPKKPVEKPVEEPVEKKPPPPKPLPKAEPEPVKPKVDPAAVKREAQKEAQRLAAEEAKQVEAQREANVKRSMGLAGASGEPSATGSAQQSAGPSSGYGGRIKARVKPNLVFTSTVSGNPLVSIEVRMAPDGTILGRPKVVKSSGNREWDEAVVRAFEKTEVLPRDTDGRVHSPLIVDWRVND
jgi:colicin import membrane protein